MTVKHTAFVAGLVFVALVYFVFCFAMASYSRSLEAHLNRQQAR